MLKLSQKSRVFLEENNINLLLLLESLNEDKENIDAGNKKEDQSDQPEQSEQSEQLDNSLNSDDEPNYSKPETRAPEPGTGEQQPDQGEQPGQQEQNPENQRAESPEQLPTIDEMLAQQIDSTDQKYVQFRLYDKIMELQELLTDSDNILFLSSAEQKEIENFKNYITILQELIFIIDVNTVYQLVGQIEIDLISFFTEVNERLLEKNSLLEKNKTNIGA